MRIACLHTAASNAAAFADLKPVDVELTHTVRADLLADAEAAGGFTEAIADRATQALLELSGGANAVLLTCSTIGPSAQRAAALTDVPVLRVDQALARAVMADGLGRAMVLYAVATSCEPTQQLFAAENGDSAVQLTFGQVSGAWPRFKAGDLAGYHAMIADAADAAFAEGYATVALAQASMSAAALLTKRGVPLTSPAAGLRAAIAAARAR